MDKNACNCYQRIGYFLDHRNFRELNLHKPIGFGNEPNESNKLFYAKSFERTPNTPRWGYGTKNFFSSTVFVNQMPSTFVSFNVISRHATLFAILKILLFV